MVQVTLNSNPERCVLTEHNAQQFLVCQDWSVVATKITKICCKSVNLLLAESISVFVVLPLYFSLRGLSSFFVNREF